MTLRMEFGINPRWVVGYDVLEACETEFLLVPVELHPVAEAASLRMEPVSQSRRREHVWGRIDRFAQLCQTPISDFGQRLRTSHVDGDLLGYMTVDQNDEKEFYIALGEKSFLRVCGWLSNENTKISLSLVSSHDYDVTGRPGSRQSLLDPTPNRSLVFAITNFTVSAEFGNRIEPEWENLPF